MRSTWPSIAWLWDTSLAPSTQEPNTPVPTGQRARVLVRAKRSQPRAREGHQVVPRCPVVSTHISLANPLAVSGSDAYVAVLVEHLTGGAAAAACGLVSSLSQLVERQPLVRAQGSIFRSNFAEISVFFSFSLVTGKRNFGIFRF